jgi:GH43 family beta-xylosidase
MLICACELVQHKTGLYHIYSCWFRKYDGWPANLCITKLENPWTVSSTFSQRQILSVPTLPWEKTPYGRTSNDRLSSNEAPQQLTNSKTGQEFVVYSAARSDNRNYCLALLELVGTDPMNPADWRKHQYPVFYQNPAAEAYGVGHASFVKSPDESEDWIGT